VDPREADFAVQFRTIHGYRRAFVHAGKGPVLLLIHGIGDSSETWRNLIPLLARDHTVIAPDLLGHGSSEKPRADYSVAAYANAMRDLLSVLGVERATVVGHSLGGGVPQCPRGAEAEQREHQLGGRGGCKAQHGVHLA
jgi:pimeloyl-ACP methyl ester carboxylesterase